MPLHIGWPDIILRLGLAFVAGCLVGLDRGKVGEAAGLRTTILVCMAAAVSMVQMNLLLVTEGKSATSFSVMDLMRLPLGILTGMGFIGAGAVLKRGNRVLGVTTAATLWFTTVMGLCIGGGQIGLGLISLAVALVVLTALKHLEKHTEQRHLGVLRVSLREEAIGQADIEALIRMANSRPLACSITCLPDKGLRDYEFIVGWKAPPETTGLPDFVKTLCRNSHLQELKWLPDGVARADPGGQSPE
ncbi:MAG TPA: MgtC/SapB family protein [Opitutaceae bacterium]|jgi:putative Mg2+ transporter-C (MgtC) family protein